ncbi:hypothetical protein ES703_17674 [subsurface metagenome]
MNKKRKKDNAQPGEQGMFYSQRLCPVCQRLIVGRSPKSWQSANSDLGNKLKAHREDCQGKQLNLCLPTGEREQSQAIEKVSLRGGEK